MSVATVNKIKIEISWLNRFNDQEFKRDDLDIADSCALLTLLRYCSEVYGIKVNLIYLPE